MATFKVQVEDLTGGISDDAAITQWLTDGAKELINLFTPSLLERCKDFSTLDTSPNSLTNIDTRGKIINIMRNDGSINQVAHYIDPKFNGQVTDSTSLYFATVASPKYTIYGTNLYIYPTPSDAQPAYVEHVQFPAVAHGDSSITKFPDEAEYLVVLYASIKSLQHSMMDLLINSDVNTALGKLPTELNKVDDIIVEASNKIDAYYSSIGDIENTNELWDGTNKRFKEIRDALLMAKETLDTGWSTDEDSGAGNDVTGIKSVGYWLDDEDVEMSSATLQAAATELRRAETSIAEIGALMSSYKLELEGVPMFLQEAASYINQAQGYISEANARVSIDSQRYQWYQAQQAKLQQDYDKGVQLLIGGSTIEK